MLTVHKWIGCVLAGGLALGAVIGSAANPTIKAPAPQWWELTGNDTSIAPSNQVYAEVGPYDLDVHSGYRPDLDYSAEVWSLPVPEFDDATWTYEPASDQPQVTYGVTEQTAAEDAGAKAEAAAQDVESAQAEAETAPADTRQAELALNGIY